MGEELPADHLIALEREACFRCDSGGLFPLLLTEGLESALGQHLCILHHGPFVIGLLRVSSRLRWSAIAGLPGQRPLAWIGVPSSRGVRILVPAFIHGIHSCSLFSYFHSFPTSSASSLRQISGAQSVRAVSSSMASFS